MFSFGTNTGYALGFQNLFGDLGNVSSSRHFLACFTGPVPADHSQIPFDSGDPFEVMKNMESGMIMNATKIPSTRDGDIDISFDPWRTVLHTKQPYFDPTYDKWSYTPKLQLFEFAYNTMLNDQMDDLSIWSVELNSYTSTSQRNHRLNYIYNGLAYYWTPFRTRDFGLRDDINDHFEYIGISSNRNAGNLFPWVLEYDEIININSFEYYRGWFSGNGNSSTSVTIEPWDPALNEGAGGWGPGVTAAITEAGADTPIEYVDLGQELTAQRFRLSFGDTASSTFHYSWLRLLGDSTPASTSDGVDLTWGLLIPYANDMSRFSNYKETRIWRPENRGSQIMVNGEYPSSLNKDIPSMLVDVGDFRHNTTVKLNKARDLQPNEVPEVLNFVLQFPRD
jgi:hypothetical protein